MIFIELEWNVCAYFVLRFLLIPILDLLWLVVNGKKQRCDASLLKENSGEQPYFWLKECFFSPIKKCRRRRKCSSVAQWNQNRFEIGPVQARSKNPFFIRILDIWAASWFPFYGKNVLLIVQYPTKGFLSLLKYFIDKRRGTVTCFSSHS